MLIHLHEIPKEGKNWTYDKQNREAKEVLRDILGDSPFHISLTIEPLGNTGSFQLRGDFKAQWPEDCSRCGDSFEFASEQSFSHLLMPKFSAARDEKTSKSNHLSDSLNFAGDMGQEVFEYQGNNFDVGSFLHEIIALARPLIPAPPVDAVGKCGFCHLPVANQIFSYDEPMAKAPRTH